jgi:hypothetical protein
VARAAALGGLAFVSLLFTAFLIFIGILLFLGEWLFGSLGWGVLLGTLLLVAVAVYAVLIAARCAYLGRSVAIAFVVGFVVAAVFGSNVLANAYRTIADGFVAVNDPGDISFLFGAAIGAVVAGIVGLVLGARSGAASGAVGGLVSGAIFGALVGVLVTGIVRLGINPATRPMIVGMVIWAVIVAVVAVIATARYGWRTALGVGGAALIGGGLFGMFTAITFGWPVAIAIGLAVWMGLATGIAIAYAANGGIDVEALKARYWPQTTIDTAKETIEWARDRIPGMKA